MGSRCASRSQPMGCKVSGRYKPMGSRASRQRGLEDSSPSTTTASRAGPDRARTSRWRWAAREVRLPPSAIRPARSGEGEEEKKEERGEEGEEEEKEEGKKEV